MPHFYFNVHDGMLRQDDEGIELPNIDSAREAAVSLFSSVLKNDAPLVARSAGWRMEVTDPTGTVLFRLDFILEASSAARVLRRREYFGGEKCSRSSPSATQSMVAVPQTLTRHSTSPGD